MSTQGTKSYHVRQIQLSPHSDDGPVPFAVALTCGRREVVQPFDLLGAQFYGVGGGVLFDAGNPLGAGNRRDVVALREQLRQNDLCRDWSRPSGDGSNLVEAECAISGAHHSARCSGAIRPVKTGLLGTIKADSLEIGRELS